MKITVLLLVLFLLTGCAANQSTPTPIVTNSQPIQNTQIYITPYKVFTPTYTTIITPSPTLKPTSTATQSAFLIHPPTPTVFPDYIELPEWLKASTKDELFMTITGVIKEGYTLSVINPSVQQQYDIPVVNKSAYFWSSDGSSINIINPDLNILSIYLQSGKVVTSVIDKTPLRFTIGVLDENIPNPLIARGELGDRNFILLDPNERDISLDNKYYVHVNYDWKENQISVENVENAEIYPITNPNDGLYDGEYAWSPVNDQLAILQATIPPQMYYWPASRLIIYDAEQQTIVASFDGDFSYLEWSHDGKKILYRRSALPGELGSYSSVPCILDVKTGESKCYYTIKFKGDSEGPSTLISKFSWFPGDKGITYLYSQYDNTVYNGNFCIYKFQDETINCPTQGIDDLIGYAVTDYDLSPTGQYIVFNYDQSYPESDYRLLPYSSLIKIDGTDYLRLWTRESYQEGRTITGERFLVNLVSYGVLWRPTVP